MKPGLIMVMDPRANRAAACVAGMLERLGAVGHPDVRAARGAGWAAAVMAPPARLDGCGAGIATRAGDLLLWTGDLAFPQTGSAGLPGESAGDLLLENLQRQGIAALADTDGAFCGAWYAASSGQWHLFNDRLGLLPLFYTTLDDGLIVAPSAALAWQAADRSLKVSEEGVTELLRAMNVMEDHTLIEGVRWLRGGHVILWGDRPRASVRVQRYWEFRHQPPTARDEDEAADEYCEALRQAVDPQTKGASGLLLGISGGMDSRLILAGAWELGRVPETFTAGWPFSEDVRFGRRLARVARAPHTFVPIDLDALPDTIHRLIVETDGLHSARHMVLGSPIPSFLEGLAGSVLLEGHAHGILGGGCVPADDDLPVDRPPHACLWARKHAHGGADPATINDLLHPPCAQRSFERWAARIDDRYRHAPGDEPWRRVEYTILHGRSGRNDVLGPGLLRRDVVVRSPATTRAIVDFAARTPGPWRRGKKLYVRVLCRRFPQFARVQRADCSGLCVCENRLLREYCWQKERIHRLWTRIAHPRTRTAGTASALATAVLFDRWREAGDLEQLTQPDARVLEWIDGRRLHEMWHQAPNDAGSRAIVLTAGTIETMIRWLERSPARRDDLPTGRVPFQTFDACRSRTGGEVACGSC